MPKIKKIVPKQTSTIRKNAPDFEPPGEFSHLRDLTDLELAGQSVYYYQQLAKYADIAAAYDREITYRERLKANS